MKTPSLLDNIYNTVIGLLKGYVQYAQTLDDIKTLTTRSGLGSQAGIIGSLLFGLASTIDFARLASR